MTISANSLLSPEKLTEFLNNGDLPRDDHGRRVVILDASFSLPGMLPNAKDKYAQAHIPGAKFFDIEDISDHSASAPHMAPRPEDFAHHMQKMGIENGDHIVIYGQNNVAMGPCRAFWMFKLYGHEHISLLNCSLDYWRATGHEIADQAATTPSADQSAYHAKFIPEYLAMIDDVKQAVADQSADIIDARPPERFDGQSPEPRQAMRAGHIPGSRNLPAGKFINGQTGGFVNLDDIASLVDRSTIAHQEKPLIASCGSGVTACVLWLGHQICGQTQIAVYDGSWSEWGHESQDTQVEKS